MLADRFGKMDSLRSSLPFLGSMKRATSMKPSRARRNFIKSVAIVGGTAISLPAFQYARVLGANDRLGIASVGTGGKGWSDLTETAKGPNTQVIALCNIDQSKDHLGQAAERFPQAATYEDWRQLLDHSKDIDAVIVSTPDFMHAPIGLAAMHLGKHLFCQKPLTHTVLEARQMQLLATKRNLITQMGNQIQSDGSYRTAVQIVRTGMIGKVREVFSWQSGSPSWPRNRERPQGADPIPASVRWDLWQGVADDRPYQEGMYHPFNWRGWQAYGTGQLGDFGCHILDPVFQALELTAPTQAKGIAPAILTETWTDRARVEYEFPGTKQTRDDSVRVTWIDGVGALPPRDRVPDIPVDYQLPAAGSVVVGDRGTLVIPHVAAPKLFPLDKFPAADYPSVASVDHYTQWADACRGIGTTTSHFGYSGPLTECVLLGTIAIRFPDQVLRWDSKQLKITNHDKAQSYVTKPYRKGWEPTWV